MSSDWRICSPWSLGSAAFLACPSKRYGGLLRGQPIELWAAVLVAMATVLRSGLKPSHAEATCAQCRMVCWRSNTVICDSRRVVTLRRDVGDATPVAADLAWHNDWYDPGNYDIPPTQLLSEVMGIGGTKWPSTRRRNATTTETTPNRTTTTMAHTTNPTITAVEVCRTGDATTQGGGEEEEEEGGIARQ